MMNLYRAPCNAFLSIKLRLLACSEWITSALFCMHLRYLFFLPFFKIKVERFDV